MEVKALACQLPRDLGLPFSRLTSAEIARQAVNRGITASISGATVWRWLSQDAIRPWCYRSWMWPLPGILVSDIYVVYRNWVNYRQMCLAHLIRKGNGLSERTDDSWPPSHRRFENPVWFFQLCKGVEIVGGYRIHLES